MIQPFVSNIQRFSVDDGPGIRSTVFFKGCNLRCAWCHNPECISSGYSIQLLSQSCKGCGRCTEVCDGGAHHIEPSGHLVTEDLAADGIHACGFIHTIERNKCIGCGKCAYYCPATAISIIGKSYEPEDLVKELLKDRMYFETSNGGVTFSGGEPMLHPEYLARVLALSKERGLHTAVDTAGNVPFSSFEKVLPYTDVFLYDIKLWDEEKHRQATGVSNQLILENLKRLLSTGANVIIRTPVIMEWNGNLREFDHISAYLASLPPVQLIQLLPYHSYGVGKYETLGLMNTIRDHTPPTQEFLEQALQFYLDRGLPAQIS